MAVKISVAVRNGMLDALEVGAVGGTGGIGATAVLKLRSGTVPTNITDTDAGTAYATLTLPSDWMQAAASGQKVKSAAAWTGTASGAGTVGHFRIYASDGTTQHLQGTVTTTGGGGDMTLDNVVLSASQAVTITGFTLTAGNA